MVAVFGHRGARGLLPENTLAGFALAKRLGLTGVEFDVGITADGLAVVHHDPHLNTDTTRNQKGEYVKPSSVLIFEHTYRELLTYDVGRLREGSDYAARFPTQKTQDGAQIPTLDEVLTTCAGLDVLVEVKSFPDRLKDTASVKNMALAVIQQLKAHDLIDHAVLYAFDWRVLDEAAILEPNLRRCCLTEAATIQNPALWFGRADLSSFRPGQPGDLPRLIASTGAKVWAPDYETLNRYEVEQAHHCGLKLIPWTVNEPEDILNMLDLGVDGIISDWPDRVLDILAERKVPLATPGFIDRNCAL